MEDWSWGNRGHVHPSKRQVDLDSVVPHLNDRDECIFEAAEVRDLWSALQKFVERVEIVLPCDVLGSDAKCVNVCPLMRDPEKIGPESNDSPTNFLVVLPLHSHAQAQALSPLLNKDIEFFDDFPTQFHALICLVSPVLPQHCF